MLNSHHPWVVSLRCRRDLNLSPSNSICSRPPPQSTELTPNHPNGKYGDEGVNTHQLFLMQVIMYMEKYFPFELTSSKQRNRFIIYNLFTLQLNIVLTSNSIFFFSISVYIGNTPFTWKSCILSKYAMHIIRNLSLRCKL